MDESLLPQEEQILRYLDDEMTAGERTAFEAQLASDAALEEQVEAMRFSVEAAALYGVHTQVASIHREAVAQYSPARRKGRVVPFRRVVRYTMAVAASILLIFIAVQGYRFYNLSPEGLYEDSFIAYNLSPVRGDEPGFTDLEKAYSEEQYAAVVHMAKEKGRVLTPREVFVAGLSSLWLNDASAAIPWFRKLNEQGNPFQPDAEFYLSLAYLKDKDFDRSLALMQKIRSNPQHPYHDRVTKSMINDIRMLKWK
jgi:anti-sigma factor RsiW